MRFFFCHRKSEAFLNRIRKDRFFVINKHRDTKQIGKPTVKMALSLILYKERSSCFPLQQFCKCLCPCLLVPVQVVVVVLQGTGMQEISDTVTRRDKAAVASLPNIPLAYKVRHGSSNRTNHVS